MPGSSKTHGDGLHLLFDVLGEQMFQASREVYTVPASLLGLPAPPAGTPQKNNMPLCGPLLVKWGCRLLRGCMAQPPHLYEFCRTNGTGTLYLARFLSS